MFQLPEQDVAAIEEVHDRWIAAELTEDLSRVIELCTEDVSWIPPNAAPISGKEAIIRYLSENNAILKDIQVEDLVIRGSGSLAYLTSNYRTRFVDAGGSEIQVATGTHLWILRRSEDGRWRVAIVTWSSWGA